MQLSEVMNAIEKALDDEREEVSASVWISIEKRVQEALRAQADARPVAWTNAKELEGVKNVGEGYARAIWGAENEHFATIPLFTHPEASAPGLSDDAKDLLSAMGFRLVDDFYLRGDVPDDSEESWEVIHRDTVSALSAGAAQLDDDAVYGVLRNYDADMARKTAEAIAHDLRLTRASAATVVEPSTRPIGVQAFERMQIEMQAQRQATYDAAYKAAQQQAEPSEPWREKLIELADQLDAELTTGVQWSSAQFACFYVSDDLRKIVKEAGGVPNEKDWKTRALEAEKLNRQFVDRWNAENGPTHMGEPVIAAQQQAEPGVDEADDCPELPTPFISVWAGSDAEDCRLDVCYTPSAPRRDGVYATKLYTAEQMRAYARAAQSGQRAGVAEDARDAVRMRFLIEGNHALISCICHDPVEHYEWSVTGIPCGWHRTQREAIDDAMGCAAPTQQPSTDQS